MKSIRVLCVLALAAASSACGSDGSTPSEFTLSRSPQHVNRVIPGERPLALVTVTAQGEGEVELTATVSLDGASATVRPASLPAGEAAEVWVELPETDTEAEFTVTVTGERDGLEHKVDITATAVPGVDDLADTATQIADVFLAELDGSVDGLPATAGELIGGTPVANLLVVTHYAWFTDEYEIGLAWHVMVAPDDWAELYIRPRNELTPSAAYKLGSWSTALGGGEFTITEIDPPVEVTR